MDKKLQEYIKDLSVKDKKTLSQKALKVSEETGELARVTLPFENAHGTTHRFVEKERVLEESVDVILAAISMAYDLGFDHEDIQEMMWSKAAKWQGIQAKEEKVDYPIPYEIHVTVDIEKSSPGQSYLKYLTGDNPKIEYFKKVCKDIGVKPIVLDLENDGGSVMKDVMTSSHFLGNNRTSYTEAKKIESSLKRSGFEVVRVKIETVPWHPAAPTESGDKMPEDCYFEAHVGCIITPEQKNDLRSIAEFNNAHLSRNFFKKMKDGKFVNMVTLRHYKGTYDEFLFQLDHLKKNLKDSKIDFDKVITEFSIYDTKVSHDFKWLDKKKEEKCPYCVEGKIDVILNSGEFFSSGDAPIIEKEPCEECGGTGKLNTKENETID